MQTTAVEIRSQHTLRDLIALTKPRITLMVVITAAGGAYLSPARIEPFRMAVLLLTMSMIVGGANALNCYLERDSDRLMKRTASRPLPSGRLAPGWGLIVGLGLGLSSLPILALSVNVLTAALGALALVSYVAIYTPMKQSSPTALLVGAVPGALPPLMGWTGATGSLDAPGFVLFGILFLWQIPHFLAISVFRQEEYERAGLKVLPSVKGIEASKAQALFYGALLLPVSVLLFPLRVAGPLYLVAALGLGVFFVGAIVKGLREDDPNVWARRVFFASLVYLTLLFGAIGVDALVG
jgi:heme o synthase